MTNKHLRIRWLHFENYDNILFLKIWIVLKVNVVFENPVDKNVL